MKTETFRGSSGEAAGGYLGGRLFGSAP